MSKQRTSTDFLCLTISAGSGKPERWADLERFGYRVKVQSDATGRTIYFEFHDSADRHTKGIDQLDRDNLLQAFWSFVTDAHYADQTFADWADDLGYDADSMSAKRDYDACRASLRKFATLWHDARTPAEIIDQLRAAGVE